MIELLPLFLSVGAASIAGAGASIGAVLKIVFLRYALTWTKRPPARKIAAVAVWEALAMLLAFLLAFISLGSPMVPGSREKWLFIAGFLVQGLAVGVVLVFIPNNYLIRSRALPNSADETPSYGIGTAALLSCITPSVTVALVLSLALLVAG